MRQPMGNGGGGVRAPLTGHPAVAVVGATGVVGSEVVRILDETGFPIRSLSLYAGARSAGREVSFRGTSQRVARFDAHAVEKDDIVFCAAGADVAREVVAARRGNTSGVVIDKSSAFRADPSVPLVVPEVNAHALRGHRGVVASPNCVAIPLSMVLAPLIQQFAIEHVSVATYQAASGAGRPLVAELELQRVAAGEGRSPEAHVYPHVLYDNVVPGGWAVDGDGVMEEEAKVVAETARIFGGIAPSMSVTTVRVPVGIGHAMAIFLRGATPFSRSDVAACLSSADGVRVVDDPALNQYPTPSQARSVDEVLVGRIHESSNDPCCIALFVASNNLRRGAALNACNIAVALQGANASR